MNTATKEFIYCKRCNVILRLSSNDMKEESVSCPKCNTINELVTAVSPAYSPRKVNCTNCNSVLMLNNKERLRGALIHCPECKMDFNNTLERLNEIPEELTVESTADNNNNEQSNISKFSTPPIYHNDSALSENTDNNEAIQKSESKVSQIKFDTTFIKRLLDKLKVGNARSIHLNAVPGRSATRLDLYQLSDIDKDLPKNFLDKLMTNDSFSFTISYDKVNLGEIDDEAKRKLALITKRLNTIVIENTDSLLEYGLENFGFGYPLLIKRDHNDPSKVVKAPLFIWNLNLERSTQNKNTWVIKRGEDYPIKINELLISHITKDESIQIEKIPKDILEDGILDESELLKLTKVILSQLNTTSIPSEIKLEKCPNAKEIDDIANSKPWIQWSGIFGIYRSQNETIIHSTEELLSRLDEFSSESLTLEPFQTSTVTSVETDPSKEEIVNTLTKDEIKLIQGPPGTGKSQSITAIVSNVLSNNGKCLIVCEKKTALDVIYTNLTKIGLGQLSILIDDVNKDRKLVIEKARTIRESPGAPYFSQRSYNDLYAKFSALKEKINSKYSESLRSVLGDLNWKQLIGLYLRYSKEVSFNDILGRLNYNDCNFNYDEYSLLVSFIEEASQLYSELGNDSESAFEIVNKSIFSTRYKWTEHEKLKNVTSEYLDIISALEKFTAGKKQGEFEKFGVSTFDVDAINNSLSLINFLIESLEKAVKSFRKGTWLIGKEFWRQNAFTKFIMRAKALYTNKYKTSLLLEKTIIKHFKEAKSLIYGLRKYNISISELVQSNKYESTEEELSYIGNIIVEANTIRLQIEDLAKYRSFLEDIETRLLKLESTNLVNYKSTRLADIKSLSSLNKFKDQLKLLFERLSLHLDSFESYHNWKYFLGNIDNYKTKLVTAFLDIPPENWRNLFIAWYYRGALHNFESKSSVGFNNSDTSLNQLSDFYSELKKQQIDQIKFTWSTNQFKLFEKTTYNFNLLYNLRKNHVGPKNSLRNIIEKDFNLFTTMFPIILTNPAAANAILPLKQGLFTVVIFDEASQLKVSDTFTTFIRGQYKIIAGDEHQMPPSSYFQSNADLLDIDEDNTNDFFTETDEQIALSESESLLQYATDLPHVNKSYLDFHYRSNHQALINFSNNAFYGGNLVTFPHFEVYRPIEFRAVNGRYETRTNPSEVAEILKILQMEIHTNQNGKYPSVGIATFNINQRNLIIETLNRVAEEDPTFGSKLRELKENGLFVKNLENIQGDERDIIIISTTYGIQPDGTFSQNFARLNRIEGYKLLNVLITRAKHKLYVCTSIPKNKYISYPELIKSEGNNKRGILYAYLAYSEAISAGDNDTAEGILELLKTQSYEKPRIMSANDGLSESPFEEEVYDLLSKHFPAEKIIQQHKVGGFRLDFIIKSKIKDIVIECDGKAYHSTEEAYAYDMFRQKELEKMGFIIYRIWSTNWFRDKELEMRKLLGFISITNNESPEVLQKSLPL